VKCISTGVVSTMHVQVCTLDRCREHPRTHLRTRSLQDVHMHLCTCSLVIWRWGNEDGRVQLVYEGNCCLAWGIIFERRKDWDIVCVLSIFNTGGSVCGCVCVYTHTHTYTAQMRYLMSRKGVYSREKWRKWISLTGSPCWPSASENHRQTG